MTIRAKSHAVELGARVAGHPDRKAVAVNWPRTVDRRLDELVERLRENGERTDRTELLAALVAAAETDPERLQRTLRAYRIARVRDVLIDAPRDSTIARLPIYGPGPRQGERDRVGQGSEGMISHAEPSSRK